MTTTKTSATVRERVDQLIGTINRGDILGAMREFYADDVEMRENSEPSTKGLSANIEREEQFVASVKAWNWTKWHAVAVDEDAGVALIEYSFQFVNQDDQTITYEQATVQRWADGKIVSERFYHG